MKTNKEHFDYFKDRCRLWLEVLSLWSWKVYYVHKVLEGEQKDAVATCNTLYCDRVATIKLNKEWGVNQPTKEALSESALHECLEILLSPLMGQAQARTWDSDEYTKEHHAVIRLLERLLGKKRED